MTRCSRSSRQKLYERVGRRGRVGPVAHACGCNLPAPRGGARRIGRRLRVPWANPMHGDAKDSSCLTPSSTHRRDLPDQRIGRRRVESPRTPAFSPRAAITRTGSPSRGAQSREGLGEVTYAVGKGARSSACLPPHAFCVAERSDAVGSGQSYNPEARGECGRAGRDSRLCPRKNRYPRGVRPPGTVYMSS